jgi:hypothetical protein
MKMGDWIGLMVLILFIFGVYFGIKLLGNQPKRTVEEFEKRAAEGGGGFGAVGNALNKVLNPAEAKSQETIMQLKDGRYNKKKREGKGNGNLE